MYVCMVWYAYVCMYGMSVFTTSLNYSKQKHALHCLTRWCLFVCDAMRRDDALRCYGRKIWCNDQIGIDQCLRNISLLCCLTWTILQVQVEGSPTWKLHWKLYHHLNLRWIPPLLKPSFFKIMFVLSAQASFRFSRFVFIKPLSIYLAIPS